MQIDILRNKIICIHCCVKNLHLFAFHFQAKAEKPFFSANHELDSLVSLIVYYFFICILFYLYFIVIIKLGDNANNGDSLGR